MFGQDTKALDGPEIGKKSEPCPFLDEKHLREKCLNSYELLLHGYPSSDERVRPGYVQNGYMMLKNRPNPENNPPQIFAIDCEMVTTRSHDGIIRKELARVSVVDHNLDVIIDALVKPEYEIIDYLTTYSGLTPRIMKNAELDLKKIQKLFLELFDRSTIFIGHSLEQDLHALKIIHINVIDTSVLYLRDFGGTKPKLKFLAAMNLNMLIQLGSGHNSTEDAQCAMMLALRRLLPNEEFIKYSERGLFAQRFFKGREKFLQIKVYPSDNCMSWINPIGKHLKHFTDRCQKQEDNENSDLKFELCPFYFYIPPKESHGRLGVAFYVGIYASSDRQFFFDYRDEFLILQKLCAQQLRLESFCRVLYKSKLPSWTYQPECMQKYKMKEVHQRFHYGKHQQKYITTEYSLPQNLNQKTTTSQPFNPIKPSTFTTAPSHVNQFSSPPLSASSPCFHSQYITSETADTTAVSYQPNSENNDEEKENDVLSSSASSSSSLAPYPSSSISSNENIPSEFHHPRYFKQCSNDSTSSGGTCDSESMSISPLATPSFNFNIPTYLDLSPTSLATDRYTTLEIKNKKLHKTNDRIQNQQIKKMNKNTNHHHHGSANGNDQIVEKNGEKTTLSSQNDKQNAKSKNYYQQQRMSSRRNLGRKKYRDRNEYGKRKNKRNKTNNIQRESQKKRILVKTV